ncbi:DUF4236 domain-containing protein [Aliivibrio fischeri]|uniref:DUF4236 domain-containing protein n=1 Tax=Aliivibrio fischeri TaxID=668 RepID=UPI0012D87390|nr:DUF4236 domain-containing protein [Aliivibrio fischeri]MUI54212.1 hypothetical protein [Aliivibrio fischeri]
MGLRFRKRLKVASGLTFNFSWSEKKGITTSSTVGAPGTNINIGIKKDGSLGVKHGTLGVPGSGLSHHKNLDNSSSSSKSTSVKNHGSESIKSLECSEGANKEENNDSSVKLKQGGYMFVALYNFAHNKTINWIVNFTILGSLFYLNN